jgi:hypothetical protein
MNEPGSHRCLMVVFRPVLTLAFVEVGNGTSPISVGGREWQVVNGTFIGFYDWLRTDTGRVIGLRQWLPQGSDLVSRFALFAGFEHVVATMPPAQPCVAVLFDQRIRTGSEALSIDQGFVFSGWYESGKEQAIVVSAEELEEKETADVRSADAVWLS